MNDTMRAKVIRDWKNQQMGELRNAVEGVRSDLVATNAGKRCSENGKWAVRYPNGDRPANEADTTFMAEARNIVISLMDKINMSENVLAETKATNQSEIDSLKTEIDSLKEKISGLTRVNENLIGTIRDDMNNSVGVESEEKDEEVSGEVAAEAAEITEEAAEAAEASESETTTPS